MTTRSTVLAVGNVVGRASNVIYLCPANHTVLVKSLIAELGNVPSADVNFKVGRQYQLELIFQRNIAAPAGGLYWAGWFVLDPSDYVAIEVANPATVKYWLSGAVLPLFSN